MNLVKWETICKPKEKGGKGIRHMTNLNKDFIEKMGWRLIENKIGWGHIMRAKYLANMHFNYNLNNNDLLGGSKVWKGILSSRPLLRKGVIWRVRNGKK